MSEVNIEALKKQVEIAELQARLVEAKYKKIAYELKLKEMDDFPPAAGSAHFAKGN